MATYEKRERLWVGRRTERARDLDKRVRRSAKRRGVIL